MCNERHDMPSWIEKNGKLTLLGNVLAWTIALTYGSYLIVRHGIDGANLKVEDMQIEQRREAWRERYTPRGKK